MRSKLTVTVLGPSVTPRPRGDAGARTPPPGDSAAGNRDSDLTDGCVRRSVLLAVPNSLAADVRRVFSSGTQRHSKFKMVATATVAALLA